MVLAVGVEPTCDQLRFQSDISRSLYARIRKRYLWHMCQESNPISKNFGGSSLYPPTAHVWLRICQSSEFIGILSVAPFYPGRSLHGAHWLNRTTIYTIPMYCTSIVLSGLMVLDSGIEPLYPDYETGGMPLSESSILFSYSDLYLFKRSVLFKR